MWSLNEASIALGNLNFEGFIDGNNNYYFAERTLTYGILDFGVVGANQTRKISLTVNNITAPVIVESIVANVPGSVNDEVKVTLFRGAEQIAYQLFNKEEMPYKHPPLILTPDLSVEVQPTKEASIFIYVRPVHILFRAIPS